MPTSRRRSLAAFLALCAAVFALGIAPARADETTLGFTVARTNLSTGELSAGVAASPLMQRRFMTSLTSAQIYAQPVIYAGVVVVTAEDDQVFGVDENTGALLWHQTMGTPDGAVPTTCHDITGQVGSTSTPVVDPTTGLVYVTARDASSGTAVWRMFAFDVRTGGLAAGWPHLIEGAATNYDPAGTPAVFDPVVVNQRPALTLTGGQVFAGFGSFCDHGDYRGWIAGVGAVGSAGPGKVHLWTSEADSTRTKPMAAFWQAGGGFASDAPGQLLAVTGNGDVPDVAQPGTSPPAALGNSVIRLAVQPDGTLRATDFFASHDAETNSNNDWDLGSGSAVLPPDGFGRVPGHPHLLLTGGKDGRLYVLDRDNLGGRGTTLADDGVVAPASLRQDAWFGRAVPYDGDGGGWIYLNMGLGSPTTGLGGGLRAYRLQGGQLSLKATVVDGFSFGSGSPVVTTAGDGTALVWVLSTGTNLVRAYRAIPSNNSLSLAYQASVGGVSKFSQIAVSGDRVFVATNIGRLYSFGPPRTPVSAVEGGDGAAYVRRAGSDFAGLGGRLAGAPAVVSLPVNGGRVPLLLVTGTDARLWARTPQTGWYPFGSASDHCVDNPAATVLGGTMYVVCHGNDGALWRSTTNVGGTLSPLAGRFTSLGGRLLDGPAVAAVGGAPTVVVNGVDGRVWSRPFDGSSPWQPHGWRCIGHPALATEASGRTVFACHGTDGAGWAATAQNQLPDAAFSLGGGLVDGVGLAAGSEGTLVSVEGTDARLWNGWITPTASFTGWTTSGGILRQGVGSADVP